jgi:hypothetical protein
MPKDSQCVGANPQVEPRAIEPREVALAEPANLEARAIRLLGELEASLRTAQQALLSHDLAGLQLATEEQSKLRCSLADLWCRQTPGAAWEPALVSAQARVLHLARVQAALLARAQRRVRMLANLRAGSDAPYAVTGDAISIRVPDGGKESACRV